MTAPVRKNPIGRPRIYNWDKVFDAVQREGSTLLVGGSRDLGDFYDGILPVRSIRGGLLNEAKKRDIRVRTAIVGGGKSLLVTLVTQSSYPWDEWLDGEWHVLTEDVDFTISPADMRRSARRVAKARGLHLESMVRDRMIKMRSTTVPPVQRPGGTRPMTAKQRREMEIHQRIMAREKAEREQRGSNTLEPRPIG